MQKEFKQVDGYQLKAGQIFRTIEEGYNYEALSVGEPTAEGYIDIKFKNLDIGEEAESVLFEGEMIFIQQEA